jgi:hypothetical protein
MAPHKRIGGPGWNEKGAATDTSDYSHGGGSQYMLRPGMDDATSGLDRAVKRWDTALREETRLSRSFDETGRASQSTAQIPAEICSDQLAEPAIMGRGQAGWPEVSRKRVNADPTAPCFPTTHWSRIDAAGDPDDPEARVAREELCRDDCSPLYAFARRRGLGGSRSSPGSTSRIGWLTDSGYVGLTRATIRGTCAWAREDGPDAGSHVRLVRAGAASRRAFAMRSRYARSPRRSRSPHRPCGASLGVASSGHGGRFEVAAELPRGLEQLHVRSVPQATHMEISAQFPDGGYGLARPHLGDDL